MKHACFTLLFIGLAGLGLAQETGLHFGFQLSPSMTWMTTNDRDINSDGVTIGLKMGVLAEAYFDPRYAFTTGVGFSFGQGGTLQYGARGNYWPSVDDPNITRPMQANTSLAYKIQYVEIPAGLKMRTREFGYLRYYLHPGVVMGFMTQGRGKVIPPNTSNSTDKIDIRSEIKNFYMGWALGGGIEYSISLSTRMIFGFNLQFGFSDVTKDHDGIVEPSSPGSNDGANEDSIAKMNGATLVVGIIF